MATKSKKPKTPKVKDKPVAPESPGKKKFSDAFKEVTANQLCLLTGKSQRTVTAKLTYVRHIRKDKNAMYYHPREALEAIYESDGDKDRQNDEDQLLKQKVRAETNRAEKASLEVEEMRKLVLKTDIVEKVWTKMKASFRARILARPSKLSLRIVGQKDVREVEKILLEDSEQALNELKDFRIEDYLIDVVEPDTLGVSAAPETDG